MPSGGASRPRHRLAKPRLRALSAASAALFARTVAVPQRGWQDKNSCEHGFCLAIHAAHLLNAEVFPYGYFASDKSDACADQQSDGDHDLKDLIRRQEIDEGLQGAEL